MISVEVWSYYWRSIFQINDSYEYLFAPDEAGVWACWLFSPLASLQMLRVMPFRITQCDDHKNKSQNNGTNSSNLNVLVCSKLRLCDDDCSAMM